MTEKLRGILTYLWLWHLCRLRHWFLFLRDSNLNGLIFIILLAAAFAANNDQDNDENNATNNTTNDRSNYIGFLIAFVFITERAVIISAVILLSCGTAKIRVIRGLVARISRRAVII